MKRWETLQRTPVATTPVFQIDAVERRSPAGVDGKFFVAQMADWVNVIAITHDEQMLLIRQYRQGTDSITMEIPGGIVDDGESYVEAARRELREETGYEADELIEIGLVDPNPALQGNRCATVLALGATPDHDTDFDEHEEIELELASLDEVESMIRRGEITHALVVAALYHYTRSYKR